jgi:hypothetical protein
MSLKLSYLAYLLSSMVVLAAQAKPVIDFSENNQSNYTDQLYAFQEKAILSQLFPKYVTDFNLCPTDESAGSTELIETSVAVARGNFSSLHNEEFVVTFMSAPCPGAHSDQHPNLALVRNLKVLDARRDVSASGIEKVFDLDGDGLSEVITSYSGGNQGYFGTNADTVTFKNGRITVDAYINGPVKSESCGANETDGLEYVAVFFAVTGSPHNVLQKNYVRACSTEPRGPFRFYSTGKLDPKF